VSGSCPIDIPLKKGNPDIKVKKEWVYLYRAVDAQGNTLDFFFSPTSDAKAAKQFLLRVLAASHSSKPRVINVDKNAAYPKAFAELKAAGFIAEACELKPGQISQ
jgi:transposase-like protein